MGSFDVFLDSGICDELGKKSGFRELMSAYIKELVDSGSWFTICYQVHVDQQDLMRIKGTDGVTLGNTVAQKYQRSSYRVAIYKYLLKNYLCYVEVPKIRQKDGLKIDTFDKILATSGIDIVQAWLGGDSTDLNPKYRARLIDTDKDVESNSFAYVKCTETKGSRGISVPRKEIDLCEKGLRVVPLFMLKAGVDTLYEHLKEGFTEITYMKDNGQKRVFTTTVDKSKVKEIYGESDYYRNGVECLYDGEFLRNSTLSRGYIRAVEIGGSKYESPTKAVNYARIARLDYGVEPDLSFVNVDLQSTTYQFEKHILTKNKHIESIKKSLIGFGLGTEKELKDLDVGGLIEWVETMELVLTTTFLRELTLFMLMHQQWFTGYTGEKAIREYIDDFSGDIGLC